MAQATAAHKANLFARERPITGERDGIRIWSIMSSRTVIETPWATWDLRQHADEVPIGA
jgi:hypothetical protein